MLNSPTKNNETPTPNGKVPSAKPLLLILFFTIIVFFLGVFLVTTYFKYHGSATTSKTVTIKPGAVLPTIPPSPSPTPTPLQGSLQAQNIGQATNTVPNPATIYAGSLPSSKGSSSVGSMPSGEQVVSQIGAHPNPTGTPLPAIINIVSGQNALAQFKAQPTSDKPISPTQNLMNGLSSGGLSGIDPSQLQSQMASANQMLQSLQTQEQQLEQGVGTMGISPTGVANNNPTDMNTINNLGSYPPGYSSTSSTPTVGSNLLSGTSGIPNTIPVQQPTNIQSNNGQAGKQDGIGDNIYHFIPTTHRCTIYAGTDIPAVLLTAVDSDSGGLITAIIPRNIYDSISQRCLMFPAGTKAIGYVGQNSAAIGQSATFAVWTRMIYPPSKEYPLGGSLQLMDFPGVGSQGETGIPSVKNTHIGQKIGPALLLTLLQAGVSLAGGSYGSSVNGVTNMTPGQAISQALAQQIATIGVQQTQQALNRPPTLSVRPGQKFFIRVVHDVVLAEPYK